MCRGASGDVRAGRTDGVAHASAGSDADCDGGSGWAQRKAVLREDIHPGDVVWFAPGEKHWHGATASTAMSHIAIQEPLDGKAVEWMEKVSEEEYLGGYGG